MLADSHTFLHRLNARTSCGRLQTDLIASRANDPEPTKLSIVFGMSGASESFDLAIRISPQAPAAGRIAAARLKVRLPRDYAGQCYPS